MQQKSNHSSENIISIQSIFIVFQNIIIKISAMEIRMDAWNLVIIWTEVYFRSVV